jgi:hypothetical protein
MEKENDLYDGFYDPYEEDSYEHDVKGITNFLRDCWLTNPKIGLGDLLEQVFGGNITQLNDEEIMSLLKEFLLQNE